MQTLVIVRHGQYGNVDLTPHGEEQMRRLARRLTQLIEGKSAIILASGAPRGRQSGQVLAAALGHIPFEIHELLWSDNRHPMKLQAALDLIYSKEEHDVVIVVTHLEYSETLAYYYGKERLAVATFPRRYTEKGSAWLIDCVAKKCERLDPDLESAQT